MINQCMLQLLLASFFTWFLVSCNDDRCIKYCISVHLARYSKVLLKNTGGEMRGYWIKCEEDKGIRYYVVSIDFWDQVKELDSIKKKSGDSVIYLYRNDSLITQEQYIFNRLNCHCNMGKQ